MQVGTSELVERIWNRDATLWTGADESRWLGWLDEPLRMQERIEELEAFALRVYEDGLTDVVLAGMGGSSLAPEVIRRTFGAESFHVLDTTHPKAIRALERKLDLAKTLFLVSSKSGSTLETRSHMDYFWEQVGDGRHFAAVTDPGSDLERAAGERGFRATFPGEPTIGGRYSALSMFGLVPAALMGVDLERLLLRTAEMVEACRLDDGNPGLELGERLGTGWSEGRDKLQINPNPGGFGLWAEQLIAESTGKQGKGLVPAPGETGDGPDRQSEEVRVEDPYELGQEFFRWEFGTAVAGALIGINPFDQPNVQEAKDRTKAILDSGDDPELEPEGEPFAGAGEGDYVAILAFVEPSEENDRRIETLVDRARKETECVVTRGYGPRYLHSTGQLHKGGPPTGVFLQVVDDPGEELPIPGQEFGFGRLIRAQAAGDYAALKERGLRVARASWEDLGV
jgi:transaldolase / glucose-6-phosphate isomerase